MLSPSLVIRRLVVQGELSCDITFSKGLNVVHAYSEDLRATNNAGKSTLVELIQHGLGKKQESKDKWYLSSIMNQLDKMYLEVGLNDDIFTIERSLNRLTAAAVIRHSTYTSDISSVPGQSVAITDMSDWFLDTLNIPSVAVSTAKGKLDPLTFPLLMRAFVLNQRLSFAAILNKVQPEQRIADIIGFLTGIIPLARFTLEKTVSEKQLEVQKLSAYHSNVQRFLMENNHISLERVVAKLSQAERDLGIAKEEQLMVQARINRGILDRDDEKTGRINSLQSQLLDLKGKIALTERNLVEIGQEQNRLETLLNSLKTDKQKVQKLKTSSVILNSVEFDACPRCLQPITSEMRMKEEYGRCCLCTRPLLTTSDTIPKIVPRTEDIDLQIEEVEIVLDDIAKEKVELQKTLDSQKNIEKELGEALDAETRVFISPVVDYLVEQAYEVAQSEAEVAVAKTLYDQIHAMDKIHEDLNQSKLEYAKLEEELKKVGKIDKERLEEFRQVFEHILREIDFLDLNTCSIDSQKLIPFINGYLYSNSGAAYTSLVVVCYHLALLELARRKESYFPLLLVIDSPNVHDINEISEDKLLHYLVKLATEKDANQSQDWQLILTTRKVIPGLDDFVKVRISKAENQMLLHKTTEKQ